MYPISNRQPDEVGIGGEHFSDPRTRQNTMRPFIEGHDQNLRSRALNSHREFSPQIHRDAGIRASSGRRRGAAQVVL
jgi:hypothetical protein